MLRWVCPECGTSIRAEALDPETAQDALVQVVREHLAAIHPRDQVNAYVQATGWLAAAGHQVELWGGPFDGARLWCPPGELPDVLGAVRGDDGAVHLLRSTTARMLTGCETYRRGVGEAPGLRGGGVRYLHDRRPL